MNAQIQDPKTGKWLPYPQNDNARGNILIDGVVYSNLAGKDKYQQASAAPADPAAPAPPEEAPAPPDKPEEDWRTPPEAPAPEAPAPAPPGPSLEYQFKGYDKDGKTVYQGSDGNLYTEDARGMNGFSRYGTNTLPTLSPTKGGTPVPGGAYTPSQGQDPGTWQAPAPAPVGTTGGTPGGTTGDTAQTGGTTGGIAAPPTLGSAAGAYGDSGGGAAPAPAAPTPAAPARPAIDPSYLKGYLDSGGAAFQAPEGSTLPGPFEYAAFQAPEGAQTPGAFSYADFQSPGAFKGVTAADLYADPSYQFRRDQAMGALQNSATGKGLLNSGGTLNDLLGLGSQFASQEYGNVWDRAQKEWQDKYNTALTDYSTNRANAVDIYGTKVGSAKDLYDTALKTYSTNRANAADTYQTQVGASNSIYDRARNEFDASVRDYYSNRDAAFDKLYKAGSLGAGAATSM